MWERKEMADVLREINMTEESVECIAKRRWRWEKIMKRWWKGKNWHEEGRKKSRRENWHLRKEEGMAKEIKVIEKGVKCIAKRQWRWEKTMKRRWRWKNWHEVRMWIEKSVEWIAKRQ